MSDLELAKARASLMVRQSGGHARTAARRLSPGFFTAANDTANAHIVALAADEARTAQVHLTAAAILNANDLAACVSAQHRAEIAKLLSDDLRQTALRQRRYARPGTSARGADCAAKIEADLPNVARAWGTVLPFGRKSKEDGDDEARVARALEAALAQALEAEAQDG